MRTSSHVSQRCFSWNLLQILSHCAATWLISSRVRTPPQSPLLKFIFIKAAERNGPMGASRKDRGVLKLVHPGRFVETLTEPITAAEVMRKNPRHSITRPDVFYFPWVVVRPESLLTPGEVFFIVPNRTIHQLWKGKSSRYCRPCSQRRDRPCYQDHQQFELASPLKECAGMMPKHRNQESFPKRLFQTS